MTAAADRHVSPWTFREKAGRAFWHIVESTLFRWSPQPCYGWRRWLLRRFGATVDPTARVRSTVTVEVPWNLSIGRNSAIGDHAVIYCLGRVTLGDRVTVSQYAHLCAGTHDFTQPDMPLLRPPVTLEDDVWVAADAFVGPGVTLHAGCVLGARSSAFRDLPAWTVCVGNPARPVRDRTPITGRD